MQEKTQDVPVASIHSTRIAHQTVEYIQQKTHAVHVAKTLSILIALHSVTSSLARTLVVPVLKILLILSALQTVLKSEDKMPGVVLAVTKNHLMFHVPLNVKKVKYLIHDVRIFVMIIQMTLHVRVMKHLVNLLLMQLMTQQQHESQNLEKILLLGVEDKTIQNQIMVIIMDMMTITMEDLPAITHFTVFTMILVMVEETKKERKELVEVLTL